MPPFSSDVQWFPSEIRTLILAVKKFEEIYNPHHEQSGQRDSQGRGWRSVAAQVGGGKTDAQCRDKWNCLRGTYRRHVRTEATNTVRRRSGWPWVDMMSFLKPFVLEKEEADSHIQILNGSVKSVLKNQVTTQKPGSQAATNTPSCQLTQHQIVNISGATSNATNTLSLAGSIYSGGIILNGNRVGIGIVQPNQGNIPVGILQPTQTNLGVNILQASKPNVSLAVQPTQTTIALGIVQPTLTTSAVQCVVVPSSQSNVTSSTNSHLQKNSCNNVPKPKESQTVQIDPISIDLEVVKNEPDDPRSPAFVDIDTIVKKELIEEEEVLMQETNFFSEESSQEDSGQLSKERKRRTTSEQEDSNGDSNQLFMRSIMTHLRGLSPYDQSVFKLKVQQLLHEMMFPKEAHQK